MRVRVEYPAATALAVTVEVGARVEAFVGEPINVRVAHEPLPTALAVASAPLDASPTIDGSRVAFDRPGLYLLRLTCGELGGEVSVGVLPREALDHFTLVHVRTGADLGAVRAMRERRLVCRALVRDADASALLDGLSSVRPLPDVSLSLYGA